eukprot:1975215-Alexandrium_andersonii.AAC.1
MLVSAAIRHNPQSAMRKNTQSLQAFEPGTARAQEGPESWPPKLPRGAFCAVLFAQIPNLPA